MPAEELPLARGWTKIVRSAVINAISVASTAMTTAWGRAASKSPRRRQQAELDRLRTQLALLSQEMEIKDARWAKLPARRRPHYDPIQRMQILQLKAAHGWSVSQTAERFLVTEETIASWLRRIDEEGERALVQTSEPVSKFPDFVAYLVRQLKLMCPALGKVRIAQILARAGLHIGATTVGRMLQRKLSPEEFEAESDVPNGRVVTAKHPNHVFHLDLTTVPTSGGFWVPWIPFAKPQRWPFCWWVAVVIDHASRLVVGFAVFPRRPSSFQMRSFLGRAIGKAGAPKYIIADKGKEFDCRAFKRWCKRRHIRPRYGAVGKHGSIAIIERFIRSMKSEGTRRVIISLRREAMRRELRTYMAWYNEHRPHRGLDGRTPMEVYTGRKSANEKPRFEPRSRWPRRSMCAAPAARVRGKRGAKLALAVGNVGGHAHLPVVQLKLAA